MSHEKIKNDAYYYLLFTTYTPTYINALLLVKNKTTIS